MPQIAPATCPPHRFSPSWRVGSNLGRGVCCIDEHGRGFAAADCRGEQPDWRSACSMAQWRQSPLQPLRHRVGGGVGAQPQDPATSMFDQASCFEHDFLHHCSHASALGLTAPRRVFTGEYALTYQALSVRRHRSQGADQIVGVKLAAGQSLHVYVGLELGMKLLVRTLVAVQRDDPGWRKAGHQCCRPAVQLLGEQQQRVAVVVNHAFDQAVNTSRGLGLSSHTNEGQGIGPNALALSFAPVTPRGGRVSDTLSGNDRNGRAARVPVDEGDDLARECFALGVYLLHELERAQTRGGTKQQRPLRQPGGHGQHAPQVQLGLQRRVLNVGAKRRHQAVPQRAQVGGAGGVAIDALIGAAHRLFLGARVVHDESIPVRRHVATGLRTKGQAEPRSCMAIHVLTQRQTRRRHTDALRPGKEAVSRKRLDGIEVGLTLYQQAQMAFDDVAVGDAVAAYGKLVINTVADVKACHVVAHQGKVRVGGQVVEQLFDNEVGHDKLTCRVAFT